MVERVIATGGARGLLAVLQNRYGPIILQMISKDGGHSVVCRTEYDLRLEAGDTWLGCVADVPVRSDAPVDQAYRGHRLIVDVQPGAGPADSLERSEGVRFVVRTMQMHPLECAWLDASFTGGYPLTAVSQEVSETRISSSPVGGRSGRRPKMTRARRVVGSVHQLEEP